ncbi:MAG TPA: xylulose 5-phosphate 3-epimerase [Dehalococcoidia bacterium]|nr:xylulose 5-phosphate 3-epimerase [Dehalococcoidia bacterium]
MADEVLEVRASERVEAALRRRPGAARWAAGYGVIQHTLETRARVLALADELEDRGVISAEAFFEILHATDRIASAGMWLVVHETYADRVYLDGRDLGPEDFKREPEGHTGGALNMVPAYAGYMAANAISGVTRSWVMGQGHTVAAIDSLNLLLGNMTPEHAGRYSLSDEGLTRYVRDFYLYRLTPQGEQKSPLGSHVNAHTAGGMVEGGYLGFTELEYVHMPLPGESLVVFLSDGAFEEQRGSDWAPRWWRAEDCGLVMPIMISNGRRIDQRTTMSQIGGVDWFLDHLRLNSFEPVVLDGRDPAAFAWAIIEQEERLRAAGELAKRGQIPYPVRLPYGIAVAPKGFGFYGAGTNLAHNLPLGANPSRDASARANFNESAHRLWVAPGELTEAAARLRNHAASGRPAERDHPLAVREVKLRELPLLPRREVPADRSDPASWSRASPMAAVDESFLAIVQANQHLRPRVGNPDEMRSNRMLKTLEALLFRVTSPEPGVPEGVLGAVVTALNEEAVCCAALANKGGIGIVVTYEAFGTKMHGAVRQEVTWAQGLRQAGRSPGWLSMPLVLTSHTWENAKNEQSHQDPSMCELMLGEPMPSSRVLFPADFNTAASVMAAVYQTQGQVWTCVVPKAASVPDLFSVEEAAALVREGALALEWASDQDPEVILTAVGAYQLEEVLKAAFRLREGGRRIRVVYMIEPGRFRAPRSGLEEALVVSREAAARLYPESVQARVFVSHTRPDRILGVLQPLDTGRATRVHGFINAGGTLSTPAMLFVNRCSWAHVVRSACELLGLAPEEALSPLELAALNGAASPHGVIIPP